MIRDVLWLVILIGGGIFLVLPVLAAALFVALGQIIGG